MDIEPIPELSPIEQEYAERFAALCRERVAPRAAQADRTGTLPRESLEELRAAGFFALFHPPEAGGTGASGALLGEVMEHLGRACASTLWTTTISTALCGKILWNLCRPAHHQRWLAPIVRGELTGCFAASERGSGNDPGSYQTTLHRTDRGFRLTGEKCRVANAPIAEVAVVLARTTGPGSGLGYAVVDLRQPGVRRTKLEPAGLRAMPWGVLQFDELELPEEDVILDATMERTLRSVEWGQLIQSCCALGVAQAALDASVAYTRERTAFGRPIMHLEVVRERLARMHVDLAGARALTRQAAGILATGRSAAEVVMMAKIHATEMGVRVTEAALRTFAGWGFQAGSLVERLHRDSLGNVPAGLTTDRLRELLMCPALGLSPWEYEPASWLTSGGFALDPEQADFLSDR